MSLSHKVIERFVVVLLGENERRDLEMRFRSKQYYQNLAVVSMPFCRMVRVCHARSLEQKRERRNTFALRRQASTSERFSSYKAD